MYLKIFPFGARCSLRRHIQAVQQGKLGEGVELQLHEFPLPEERESSAEGDETTQWRSSTTVRGREYTWIHTAPKKKMAKHEAAAMLLEELLPGKEWVGRHSRDNCTAPLYRRQKRTVTWCDTALDMIPLVCPQMQDGVGVRFIYLLVNVVTGINSSIIIHCALQCALLRNLMMSMVTSRACKMTSFSLSHWSRTFPGKFLLSSGFSLHSGIEDVFLETCLRVRG